SATKVYEKLVARVPDRTDILELLTRIYEQQRDLSLFCKKEREKESSKEREREKTLINLNF
ncbi:MAG: hypothetical protein IKN12_10420, partial [Selenomonadaceae bacterium]|nr:hypothetical protein [Selenomonadaceae bacterium]